MFIYASARQALRLILAAGLCVFWASALAQTSCANLRTLDSASFPLPTKILTSALVTVGPEGLPSSLPRTAPTLAISQYCAVTGYVAPQHQFEIRLPLPDQWNRKLFFSACAGFCGAVNGGACNQGLLLGYASVTSNGGHVSAPGFDGVWAVNDTDAQEDFAYRGNHNVAVATKKIIEAFYGEAARRAYMSGCSKGGQATLASALRYPNDFDGYVTIAPVYDYTGKGAIHGSWVAQAQDNGSGGTLLDNAATDLVHQAVLAACDKQTDGALDGVVGDPLSCNWKPSDLACRAGQTTGCLSAAQVVALTKLYAAPTDSHGRLQFPTGNTLGAEIGEWKAWVNGLSINYLVSKELIRYLAFAEYPNKALSDDPLKFNFDRDPVKLARGRTVYDASSVDLRAFKARGGKILMWHGWADSGIPAGSSIHYYLRATEFFGQHETESFFRLFLLPGVTHCGGGDGSDRADMLTTLDEWVEHGTAPERIITTKLIGGSEARARPVFAYPKSARYKGAGSVDDPANWTAVEPTRLPEPTRVRWYSDPRNGGRDDDRD
jgi:tannase/feruloyl esterase